MNRFLTRKKEKKRQPEPKPQIDIAAALPAADDFRTSLIMPGLSTRFSMLREQDDPSSKIGKASDDSVLHPKRQSRLHEFGFAPTGLSDIAEVSSLHGSARRLATERKGSMDSHATDDGGSSIMSRSRPGEKNVLFGGRQKVFKISNTGSSQGKQLYDDDVHLSYFQKMKVQEKERLAAQEALEQNSVADEPISPGKDTFSLSTDGFSKRRETSSSTNSGSNARSSTAATSIASQGGASVAAAPSSPTELTRTTTKGRRLYEQGLDQQLHEQQSSAMSRLNSIQRARGPGRATPPLLFTQSRSATNLNDRFNRGPASRTESPTFAHSPGLPSTRDVQSNGSSPTLSRPQSPALIGPLSPLSNNSEEAQALNIALQPQDRGKATAMGAFNKPKHAFSEEQYAERTKRMQQERDASTPKLSLPRKLSLRERAEMEKRKRAGAGSSPEQPQPTAFSMFHSAAAQMRSPPADSPPVPPKPTTETVQSPVSQKNATFLTSAGSSDDEGEVTPPLATKPVERGRRLENLPTATGPAPPIFEHPALRSRSNSGPRDNFEPPTVMEPPQAESPTPAQADSTTETKNLDVDSPTLGPNAGGLSGLVRQHLRNVSNVSSIYDDNQSVISPPPTQTQHVGVQRRQPASESDSLTYSGYSHSNPWDLDDLESNPYYADRGSVSSVSPTAEMPKQKLPAPTTLSMSPTERTFPKDEEKMHQRGRSTEEHEALQSDLAKRQRAIQQSLRAKAEGRSASPGAPIPTPSGGLKNALNMLRAKSSRESFATVEINRAPDASKAMKKLGLGANANGSTTSLANEWKADGPSTRRPLRMRQQSDTRQRSTAEDNAKGRSPPSSRERSNSPNSGARSASRPRTLYRDDIEQSMAAGISVSRSTVYPVNEMPSLPGYAANATQPLPIDKPSPDKQGRLRSRSNSRNTAGKHLQPIQTGPGAANGGGKPPQFSPGLPVSPRPSPGGPSPSMNAFRPQGSPVPPFSANNTPPVSNPGTPMSAAFIPKSVVPAPTIKTGTLRKKSIAKADIGDPQLVSTTSVIDTISLADASIKNSMEHAPPPVPPINPMRRRGGTGKSEYFDPAVQHGLDAPPAPFVNTGRANSSDAVPSQSNFSKPILRSATSEGKSLRGLARSQTDNATSPPMPAMPFGRNNSPPRPIYDQPIPQKNMDGAMF